MSHHSIKKLQEGYKMRKIYIPTSTLNFNNILSTESISPVAFYADRNFGYKRFTKVDPNNFDNSIIAYSQIPEFSIEESELDNYPFIIEVSEDLIKSMPEPTEINGIQIYQINETIYFHTNKTRLLFFLEEHKKICLIKSTPSIETKLIPIYEPRISLITSEYDSFEWKKEYLKSIVDTGTTFQYILNDKRLNAAKGFYFSYILGQMYSYMNEESNLIDVLRNNNLHRTKLITEKKFNDITKLNIEEAKQLNEFNTEKIKFDVFFDDDYKVNSLHDNDKANLYRQVINSLFECEIANAEKFKNSKVDLLLKIGEKYKDFSDNWDNSEERIYINNLLDHLETYTPFNLGETTDLVLKSVALFILKGDNLEKLLNALNENKISIYKYAFGLWGATFGFSSIPKTISNIIFEKNNIDNTQMFYRNVHNKLHNNLIENDIEIIPISKNEILLDEEIIHENDNYLECPKCKSEMKLIDGKHGKFYGCSKYPITQCDGNRSYPINKNSNNGNEIVNFLNIVEKDSLADILYRIGENKEKLSQIKKAYNVEELIQKIITLNSKQDLNLFLESLELESLQDILFRKGSETKKKIKEQYSEKNILIDRISDLYKTTWIT